MKGLILAGGAGTRLRPITHTSANQLVPVANKPILFYGIEDMAEAGIHEIGIIVGDTQAEIRAAVGDGSAFGLAVTYIPQDAPRGLAHAVLIAEGFLAGEPFVMYLGDNLLADGITGLVEEFVRDRPDALILLQHVTDPSSFGIAELDAEGGLPVDELKRTPAGRIDRDSADEVFARRKAETEEAPGDWRSWFRLAIAYHDARDTARARRAMQHAIALHDGKPVRA